MIVKNALVKSVHYVTQCSVCSSAAVTALGQRNKNRRSDVTNDAIVALRYLNDNRLKSVPQFVALPTLHVLSLTHNEISWIEPTAFSKLPKLQKL